MQDETRGGAVTVARRDNPHHSVVPVRAAVIPAGPRDGDEHAMTRTPAVESHVQVGRQVAASSANVTTVLVERVAQAAKSS